MIAGNRIETGYFSPLVQSTILRNRMEHRRFLPGYDLQLLKPSVSFNYCFGYLGSFMTCSCWNPYQFDLLSFL